ncbi:hypothetical protein B0H11DRAFT_2188445 [Mycena galericulata]|nr:hypothetical protein B0H11DRAFT_2188445 [Mycena galericulata]
MALQKTSAHFTAVLSPLRLSKLPGGQGGAGGSSLGIGGDGGRGEGPRIPAEEAHNFDMWGGIGGPGGHGDREGGNGGLGERPNNTESLLPPGTQLPNITVQEFCELFELNSGIAWILAEVGLETVEALGDLPSIELRDVGLGIGHIAQLKVALRKLARMYHD